MDLDRVYETLRQHYQALRTGASACDVGKTDARTKVLKTVGDAVRLFETQYGEKSFVPHNFDDIMARCASTQRKGFEKLQPMVEQFLCFDSLEALLDSPGMLLERVEVEGSEKIIMRISKQVENSNFWVGFEIDAQITEATEGTKKISHFYLYENIPGQDPVQVSSWEWVMYLRQGIVLQSVFFQEGERVKISFSNIEEAKEWIYFVPNDLSFGKAGPVVVISEVKNYFKWKITQPQPMRDLMSVLKIQFDGSNTKAEGYTLLADLKTIMENEWQYEMSPGNYFLRKSVNFLKHIDLKDSYIYEGEVAFTEGGFTPEGKGVWTQAEPFQRKEGIFKAGKMISGSVESGETVVYTDDAQKAFPKNLKIKLKSSGIVTEGMHNGTDFVGDVLTFIPGQFLQFGDPSKSGVPSQSKLWRFKQKHYAEGIFVNGELIDGALYEISPEETNLPEQEFPDLNTVKILMKYEGQVRNGQPHGFGTLTDYQGEFATVAEFKDGEICGHFKQTCDDGTIMEGFSEDGLIQQGTFTFADGGSFPFLFQGHNFYAAESAATLVAKSPLAGATVSIGQQEFELMKMRLENERLQSAQTAAGESKNPENKSNMMAGRDWSVSEGSLTGGNYYQGGHSTSLSFGARLPLGFWPLFGFSRAMIVNTPCWQARPYSTRGLYQGCLQTVLPLRQPVLKMLFRRFK